MGGEILHGKIVEVIGLHVGNGLLQGCPTGSTCVAVHLMAAHEQGKEPVEFPQSLVILCSVGRSGTVSYRNAPLQRRFQPVMKHRRLPRQTAAGKNSVHIRASKSNPDVFPGIALIGTVGCGMVGRDEKCVGGAEGILSAILLESTFAAQNVVNDVVVTHRGTETVAGRTGFTAAVADRKPAGAALLFKSIGGITDHDGTLPSQCIIPDKPAGCNIRAKTGNIRSCKKMAAAVE